ncbi:hypothetical protein Peur_047936 [Populus x canadensis]
MNTTRKRDFSENTSYKSGNSSNLSLTTSFLINKSPISPPSTRPASLYSSPSSLILLLRRRRWSLSWWSQRRSRVRRGAETTAINQEWGELIGFNFYYD